jgi:hypothetical protein
MTLDSTRTRMVVVAVVVCGFAVGMAGLLNYFKYRSTANRIVAERMAVTGKAVESSIQSALELGLQFADIATLPGTLDRERATDELIKGIDVFDTDGKLLYTTDRMRANRPVPEAWLTAARKANAEENWFVDADEDAAAGISVKNNFGLTIGYLALRYSHDKVREEAAAVGRQLGLMTLAMFVLSASLSAMALLAVMRRLTGDVAMVEQALRSGTSAPAFVRASRGPFGRGLVHFVKTTREVETRIAELRARLQRGANP